MNKNSIELHATLSTHAATVDFPAARTPSSWNVARSTSPRRGAAVQQESRFRTEASVSESSWIAVRCWAKTTERRPCFAHTAPSHIEIEGRPLRARRVEVEYLMKRASDQIDRSGDLLPEAARQEYSHALVVYRKLLNGAR